MKHTIFVFVALVTIVTSCKKQVEAPKLNPADAEQPSTAQDWDDAQVPNTPTPYPDIVITYLYVSPLTIDNRDGQNHTPYRFIKYTIKNIGTKDASLNLIAMQGFRVYNNADGSTSSSPACGENAQQSTLNATLSPGESFTNDFLCYGSNHAGGDRYKLIADYNNTVRELNENNNTKSIPLP